MGKRASNSTTELRVYVLLALMLVTLASLLGALFHVQVARGHDYESSLRRQSMRRVRLAAPRGRIFDRAGVCLADNRPSYCLALYLEELRQPGKWKHTVAAVRRVLETLTVVLGREPALSEADIWRHIRKRLPLPLIAWRDLSARDLARLAESTAEVEGVDVAVEPVRYYPETGLAAHVIGYVGRADLSTAEGDYQFHLPEMEGRAGLEARYNAQMAGEPGGQLVRVDASGFKFAESAERAPQAGADLTLALDARIQRLAEQAIGDVAGAVVVLDPETGDVLALASAPGFDPNAFVPTLPALTWTELLNDPARPLANRAVAEVYAPGSIFKPVVALAALRAQRATAATTFDCPGYFALGSFRLGCWNTAGHGPLALRRAIEQSCNHYFAALGLQCGYDAVYAMAADLGLGQPTGVEAEREAAGLLPNDAWKFKRWHDHWRPGDTCNVSIGQGPLTVTPLQMAVVAAAIANRGRVWRPRLVLRWGAPGGTPTEVLPRVVRTLTVSPDAWAAVRGGMYDVVMADSGTGARARVPGVAMGGKTGTAEYGAKAERRKHGWMLVFAPFEQPRYAVAMVVDEAVSGGVTVAPRMQVLMNGILNGAAIGADPGQRGAGG